MSIQDQYTSAFRQSQEAWTGAIQAVTQNVQNAFGQSTKSWGSTDPVAAIDQLFEFWKQALDVQRDMAKQLVGATVATGETVRSQAESLATAFRDQAESAGVAIREQVESVAAAARQQAETVEQTAHDQAAKKFESLTKDELQDELGRRNLPKSGNVEELRDRLIADDQK